MHKSSGLIGRRCQRAGDKLAYRYLTFNEPSPRVSIRKALLAAIYVMDASGTLINGAILRLAVSWIKWTA